MSSTLLQGMAFPTAVYNDLTPVISVTAGVLPTPAGTTTVTATKFKFSLNSGRTWLIYSSSMLTLRFSNKQENGVMVTSITGTSKFTGVIRMALMANPEDESVYDANSDLIPTGKWCIKYSMKPTQHHKDRPCVARPLHPGNAAERTMIMLACTMHDA